MVGKLSELVTLIGKKYEDHLISDLTLHLWHSQHLVTSVKINLVEHNFV